MPRAKIVNPSSKVVSFSAKDILNRAHEGHWFLKIDDNSLVMVVQYASVQFQIIDIESGNRLYDNYDKIDKIDEFRFIPVKVTIEVEPVKE